MPKKIDPEVRERALRSLGTHSGSTVTGSECRRYVHQPIGRSPCPGYHRDPRDRSGIQCDVTVGVSARGTSQGRRAPGLVAFQPSSSCCDGKAAPQQDEQWHQGEPTRRAYGEELSLRFGRAVQRMLLSHNVALTTGLPGLSHRFLCSATPGLGDHRANAKLRADPIYTTQPGVCCVRVNGFSLLTFGLPSGLSCAPRFFRSSLSSQPTGSFT